MPRHHRRRGRGHASAVGLACLAWACGDVEPGDPYVTTSPYTVTSVGTADTGDDPSTGTDASASTDADTTGADSTGADATDTGHCNLGTEGCPCSDGDACDPGLTCLSQICVDAEPDCPIGTAGCPCTMGGACDPGLECVSMTCVG